MLTITKKPENHYVLLADDDPDDCMFFNEAFREVNLCLDLIVFRSGVELLDFMNLDNVMPPQLIFLDLNMPMKNGLECLKELKQSEKSKNIPVIMYSTSGAREDIERCMAAKAHLYIRKPNSFSQLKTVIHKVLVTDFVNHLIEPAKEKFLVFSENSPPAC